ncbi:hypothetical protein HK099_007335 [Clydaea vesicula]|uniref:Uncharacterized protein n=1 Tax=Clydaea vesicula TaxID=447962 RepID=A0AAD5Y0M5_9FUNG|nr:hypothetical protein HK099_007335 [Clydaea vesicula]KAJ3391470.1 hypothetical protein HDU92_009030 [Lobulomyces angularis]
MSNNHPNQSKRAQCWEARDFYFNCLNRNDLWLVGLNPKTYDEILNVNITNPAIKCEKDKNLTKEERRELFKCKPELLNFEKSCLKSWVTHFSLIRIKELQTDELKKSIESRENERAKNEEGFWDKMKK